MRESKKSEGGGLLKSPPPGSYRVKSVRFNNTPKCVENCDHDQLSYICSSNYYQFFCNLDYNSENSVFLVRYGTNSLVRLCSLSVTNTDY